MGAAQNEGTVVDL